MLKKTKIICTQGPATDAEGVIEKLIENGEVKVYQCKEHYGDK